MSFSCLALAFLTAFALRTRLARLNKKNREILDQMPAEEKARMNAAKDADVHEELADSDPRYVFMT